MGVTGVCRERADTLMPHGTNWKRGTSVGNVKVENQPEAPYTRYQVGTNPILGKEMAG